MDFKWWYAVDLDAVHCTFHLETPNAYVYVCICVYVWSNTSNKIHIRCDKKGQHNNR